MIIHEVVGPDPLRFALTVRNARNSWGSHEHSDSYMESITHDEHGVIPIKYHIGEKDLALLTRLAVAGGDHGKFDRALPIDIEATVTGTMLRQLYTYRAGTMIDGGEPIDSYEPTDLMINSTSVMHTAGRRPFQMSDIDTDGMAPGIAAEMIRLINAQRDYWIACGKKKPSDEWLGMVNLIPAGWKYTIHLSFNYRVGRSIWQGRHNHRLERDWRVLCAALENLPYSQIMWMTRMKS